MLGDSVGFQTRHVKWEEKWEGSRGDVGGEELEGWTHPWSCFTDERCGDHDVYVTLDTVSLALWHHFLCAVLSCARRGHHLWTMTEALSFNGCCLLMLFPSSKQTGYLRKGTLAFWVSEPR